MTFRPTLLALALVFSAGARADETPAQSPPPAIVQEKVNLQNYATANPACVEWSDGCAVCRRAMSVQCSTPGIACQPGDIVCKAP